MSKPLWCRRPNTYKEWRSLWHSLAKELGRHVYYCVQHGEPPMDRYAYKMTRQMHRVWLRLQVEEEANTESYREACAEMFLNELEGGGEIDAA